MLTTPSDNGTTFIGANNQLKELKDCLLREAIRSQIQEYFSEQFIDWKFIPPYFPHMGGIWEAGVKSAKTHMCKIIGTMPMSLEKLYTVLISLEAYLNSRPLTPLFSDPADLQPLTPGHFLIGEAMIAVPEQVLDVFTNRLTRYQLLRTYSAAADLPPSREGAGWPSSSSKNMAKIRALRT
ncbi:uncharacterized protein LOC105840900 [Monomorium pharaonis]|uniref:uncharacterized protein LOC105840900 n=1 Tax=Monomorium pharaonis TaxID=307658 RepID=UPI00063FB575|nr:uncharacterized protein LOC105840900 [Monomorium pharaonis]